MSGAFWALAIHGGAGTIAKDLPEEVQRGYHEGLAAALRVGGAVLEQGGPSLEAVCAAVAALEDDPLFNAGRGAVFHAGGGHELDASVMEGAALRCGAVAAVTTAKNPVWLARRVLEGTPHVLLVGAGADAFAKEEGLEEVPQRYFSTDKRRAQWEAVQKQGGLARSEDAPERDGAKGTVGAVAVCVRGHVAAATSTGGLTHKRPGRAGDSSQIGAGTYADDRAAAVSCTGSGEEFQRHVAAYALCARMRHLGEDVGAAARAVIHEHMAPGDGGLIAVDAEGRIAFAFSSEGMYRGALDARGRFETAIW